MSAILVIERRMERQNDELVLARAEGRPTGGILRRAARLGIVWRQLREEGGL